MIGVGDAGADRQRVGGFLDLRQLGDAGQIDQHIRLRQAKVEHGAERLAAGDEFDGQVAAFRQRNRSSGIRRALVLEPNRLHDRARCAIACRMRRGVIGDTSNSAPSGRSASFTALAIAAGGAMAPPSPMPLTPNSV